MTEVRVARTDGEREDCFDVRHAVFVEEQGVPEEIEWDEHDETATHFVAYDEGTPVGAARLRETESGVGKVERVAVLEDRRGEGIGTAVMDQLEATAAREGYDELALHSQTHASEFYDRLGYERVGEEFLEADIPHVEMRKPL